MRPIFNIILVAICFSASPCLRAVDERPQTPGVVVPVNSIDPVTGLPVVGTLEPLTVTLLPWPGDRNSKGAPNPPERVTIGFSGPESRLAVKNADDRTRDLYGSAAKRDMVVKDGALDTASVAARRSVNSIDPVSGQTVVEAVGTLNVPLQPADADRPGVRDPSGYPVAPRWVVIGFSEANSRIQVESADARTRDLYARAALQNRIIKDGMISDPPVHHARAINTIDPVTGTVVVESVEPLTVVLGSFPRVDRHVPDISEPGERVTIGFSEISSRMQVQAADVRLQEVYARAAKQNRIVRGGEITDLPAPGTPAR